MKIFLENLPLGDVPEPDRRAGEFFPRLIGLRVSNVGNHWADIEPIYIPLLRIQRRAGQILIEINTDRPLVYITLQARRPYLSVFRFQWKDETSDYQ